MLGGLAETATGIVARAASVLEEEIAAGIVAAKAVENTFLNVDAVRTGKSQEVLLRLRRDVHEVVDILIDLAVVSINAVGRLTRNVIKIRAEAAGAGDSASFSTPTAPAVSPISSAHAGETVTLSLSLENDGNAPTERFSFQATDLVAPSGDRIPALQISYEPSSLVIGPHDRAQVAISIAVPEGTAPGVYAGLLQATNLGQLRAMLLISVEEG